MEIWQYNAYCQGIRIKEADNLSILLQAAYYEAYWNGASKHKVSLERVIKDVYKRVMPAKPKKAINFEEASKEFKNMEDLKKYGWFKE